MTSVNARSSANSLSKSIWTLSAKASHRMTPAAPAANKPALALYVVTMFCTHAATATVAAAVATA